eukprot:3674505-Prymnesium_polylepis.1
MAHANPNMAHANPNLAHANPNMAPFARRAGGIGAVRGERRARAIGDGSAGPTRPDGGLARLGQVRPTAD